MAQILNKKFFGLSVLIWLVIASLVVAVMDLGGIRTKVLDMVKGVIPF